MARTKTGGVCSDVNNCATPTPPLTGNSDGCITVEARPCQCPPALRCLFSPPPPAPFRALHTPTRLALAFGIAITTQLCKHSPALCTHPARRVQIANEGAREDNRGTQPLP
jgi:hypothetical protein